MCAITVLYSTFHVSFYFLIHLTCTVSAVSIIQVASTTCRATGYQNMAIIWHNIIMV